MWLSKLSYPFKKNKNTPPQTHIISGMHKLYSLRAEKRKIIKELKKKKPTTSIPSENKKYSKEKIKQDSENSLSY